MTTTFSRLLLLSVLIVLAACSGGDNTSSIDATWDHLAKSIDYKNQANRIGNAGTSSAVMDPDDFDEMQRLWGLALEEARQVDASVLNADEPGLGDRYENEFQRGLELVTNAGSNDELIQGQLILSRFDDYFEELRVRKLSQ